MTNTRIQLAVSLPTEFIPSNCREERARRIRRLGLRSFAHVFLFVLAFTVSVFGQGSALTNEDVVKMSRAGLSERIIVATILSQPSAFDTTSGALIALKTQEVPESVIQAILSKSTDSSRALQPEGEVVLSDGSEITLRLLGELSSATARRGDRVDFEVVDDVTVENHVVIAKGARARGEVVEASKKKSFGRKGKLNFTIDVVEAVDGQNIRLRTTKEAQGDDKYGKAAVVTILTGPFGWFVKGKDIEVAAGQEYTIYIDGDRKINIRPPSMHLPTN